jgi:alpha-tubulin suppressor-like RCC1 family protein
MLPGAFQAGVAKLVDAWDLKSLGGNPVRVRIPAPALVVRADGALKPVAAVVLTAVLAACSLDVADPNPLVPFALSRMVASSHTCGLTSAGVAWCWGLGAYGQLGDDRRDAYSPTPVEAHTTVRFTALAAGSLHTCGIATDSTAWCWGDSNGGATGDSTAAWGPTTGFVGARPAPVPVSGQLKFVALTAGSQHTCGLATTGVAYCWGSNSVGQLGGGELGPHRAPTPVLSNFAFKSVSAGDFYTCGLDLNGAAWCWGMNASGRLGNGGGANANGPVAVAGGLTFTALANGKGGHTCGIATSGANYCWGVNSYGQLGDSTTISRFSPVQVAGATTFASIAPGSSHTCALTAAGAAYCWGLNGSGALGDATTTNRSTPTAVVGGVTYKALASYQHTCGEGTDGIAYCWGRNANGQLGDGGIYNRPGPAPVRSPPP